MREPWTVATDLMLALLSAIFGVKLLGQQQALTAQWWGIMMLALTLSSLSGAVAHAMPLDSSVEQFSWLITVLSLPFIAVSLGFSLATYLRQGKAVRFVLILKLVFFLVVAYTARDFRYAIVDYSIPMLLWLVVAAKRGLIVLLVGLILSVAAALIQQLQLGFSASFNHNDVYHVVQAIALYFLYKGALQLED